MNNTLVKLAPDINPGELVLRTESGTAVVPNVQFYDENGRVRAFDEPSTHLGTLTVDTNATKISELWRTSFTPDKNVGAWDLLVASGSRIAGISSDPITTSPVLVHETASLIGAPITRIPVGERLLIGDIPALALAGGVGGALVHVPNTVAISPETGYIIYGGAKYEVKHASVEMSSSGDNTVVASVFGRRILLVQAQLVAAGAVSVRWKSGGATNRSGPMALAANGGIVTPFSNSGWFSTVAGSALVLNLSAAVAVAGTVSYAEVP